MRAPTDSQLPRFITVDEFARLAARNRFTVYHQTKREPEKLPRVTRLHGRVLFLDSDVRAWFAAVSGETAPSSEVSTAQARPRGRPRKQPSQVQAVGTSREVQP